MNIDFSYTLDGVAWKNFPIEISSFFVIQENSILDSKMLFDNPIEYVNNDDKEHIKSVIINILNAEKLEKRVIKTIYKENQKHYFMQIKTLLKDTIREEIIICTKTNLLHNEEITSFLRVKKIGITYQPFEQYYIRKNLNGEQIKVSKIKSDIEI